MTSLSKAVGSYTISRGIRFSQKELDFALTAFFARCVRKDFIPSFPTLEEVDSGINWRASIGMPSP